MQDVILMGVKMVYRSQPCTLCYFEFIVSYMQVQHISFNCLHASHMEDICMRAEKPMKPLEKVMTLNNTDFVLNFMNFMHVHNFCTFFQLWIFHPIITYVHHGYICLYIHTYIHTIMVEVNIKLPYRDVQL